MWSRQRVDGRDKPHYLQSRTSFSPIETKPNKKEIGVRHQLKGFLPGRAVATHLGWPVNDGIQSRGREGKDESMNVAWRKGDGVGELQQVCDGSWCLQRCCQMRSMLFSVRNIQWARQSGYRLSAFAGASRSGHTDQAGYRKDDQPVGNFG